MPSLEVFLVRMMERSPHSHSDLEIGLLLSGSLSLFIDQSECVLHSGGLYLINRGQIHSFREITGENRILAFQISTEFLKMISPDMELLWFEQQVPGDFHNDDRKLAGSLLMECAKHYYSESPFHELSCISSMVQALALLIDRLPYHVTSQAEASAAMQRAGRLNRIMDYMQEHFRENISLAELAEREQISPFTLSHLITNLCGISFQEYLNQLRFHEALKLITYSDLGIVDISLETGFSSTRYLNTAFQKMYGCSVREYRKAKKKPEGRIQLLPSGNRQIRYSDEQAGKMLHNSGE